MESPVSISRATLLAADSPAPFGSGRFLECTQATGATRLPTAAERNPGDSHALDTRNGPSRCGDFPGTQGPHDLRIIHNSVMVLLSSRLTHPTPASGSSPVVESVYFQQQRVLALPLVFLTQEWLVIRASAPSDASVQLTAFVTDDQGGNH